ncbi:MAG: amidohydrolase family protein, partial [Beijerinckiaceae bacterium]
PYPVIDFHCHHVPAQFGIQPPADIPHYQQPAWARTRQMMADEALLMHAVEKGDLAARVVNIPAAQVADADGRVPHETIMAMNDHIAEMAQRRKGRVLPLATIDAYDGERAGREVERAVGELGLLGIFVDAGRGDALIDAREARPALAAAARLGAPVFVHPVNPQPMTQRMTPYGRIGTLFARGTINAQALIALMEGGVFAELPNLRVVVTALAYGGMAVAAEFEQFSKHEAGAIALMRKHVWIDTMGFKPALIRAAADLLGADHVMCGSDWPILNEGPLTATVANALQAAGFSTDEQAAIASGNAKALLGVG